MFTMTQKVMRTVIHSDTPGSKPNYVFAFSNPQEIIQTLLSNTSVFLNVWTTFYLIIEIAEINSNSFAKITFF